MRRLSLLIALLLLLSACAVQIAPAPDTIDPTVAPVETPDDAQTPSCTLTIRCDTVLDRLDELPLGTASLIPEDGCFLAETTVPLQAEDSVFSVLQRVAEEQGLHLEFSTSPLYGSKYVEGLCNLYEMDCGALSGWTYSVNSVFPSYGLDQYTLSDGDVVQILYTCDLGADVGNDYSEATP